MMAAMREPEFVDVPAVGVATPAGIDAWMESAQAGEVMIYARRAFVTGSSGAARMRALADRGLVELSQRRCDLDPSLFQYRARRTSVPSAMTRPDRAKLVLELTPVMADEAAAIDALLPVLTRTAQYSRPCPTNKQLAELSGLALDVIKPALDAMVAARLILIAGVAAPTSRRVTILSNGWQTGFAR